MSKKTKDFNLQEFLDKKRRRKPFKIAAVFLALAIFIGGFVGVWSTGVIQKAIYNSQDLPDYVSYVDHTHSYTKTVVEPTCTEQGYTLYECRYCDMSYKQDYTATIDHDYQEVVLEQATTTSYGKAELVCSMCGDVKYEITLPLVGHTFTSEVVEPTCTEDGYTIHRSTDTDDMYIDEVIPATGHSMRLKDNYFYCETCGVMEYIEDCAAYGCLNGAGLYENVNGVYQAITSREYWYADSNGVLYLAGDQNGASNFWNYSNVSDVESYTKVVYLDTATNIEPESLPDTVTEVTFLADHVVCYYGQTGDFVFPSGVETVVFSGDYEELSIEGLGIKSLTISGNIEYLTGIICPSLEEIELGEGIENICGYSYLTSSASYGATLNFGKVGTVVFPHSAKYIYLSIETYSREYLEADEQDSSYGFDWSVYLPNMTDAVVNEHYLPMTPEEYLEWQERGTGGVGLSLEEYLGFSYEEYVVAYEAYTAYVETLEATCNEKPILVVQEGTESISFLYDTWEYDYETQTVTTTVENMIIFLPSTITTVTFEANVYNNVTIYYAGSQTDLLEVVDSNSILVGSGWRDCVICNTEYSGQ